MEKLTLSPNNNVRLFNYELNENKKMIEVPSPVSNDSNVLAVQSYTGLHLEPPTRDVVSFASNFLLIFSLLFFIFLFFHERSILIFFYFLKNILLFYNNHFVWIINTRKYFNFNFGFLSIILTTTDSINIMMQKKSI